MTITAIDQRYHGPVSLWRERSATDQCSVSTPAAEQRLWKITRQTGAQRKTESVLFMAFGMLSVGALLYAFSTLWQFLNDDALTRVVQILVR